jgi:hypothetical protein
VWLVQWFSLAPSLFELSTGSPDAARSANQKPETLEIPEGKRKLSRDRKKQKSVASGRPRRRAARRSFEDSRRDSGTHNNEPYKEMRRETRVNWWASTGLPIDSDRRTAFPP